MPPSPMALFTVWKTKWLMPVAIKINANQPNGQVHVLLKYLFK